MCMFMHFCGCITRMLLYMCVCVYIYPTCVHVRRCASRTCMRLRVWTVGLEVCVGLAAHKSFPAAQREVTFVINRAQTSAQGSCQAGLSLKGLMPDHHHHHHPSNTGPTHEPLALHNLDRKELTLAF